MTKALRSAAKPAAADRFEKEALRVLRRLCETGAVLAIAAEMDMAVVVREGEGGSSTRTAVVAQDIAQDMAVHGWIETRGTGRVLRYTITPAGRSAVKTFLDSCTETPAQMELAEAPARFEPAPRAWGERTVRDDTGEMRTVCYNLSDSPLTALARRRDKEGQPFLTDDLVHAGERLREDFELAQIEPREAQDWGNLMGAAPSNDSAGALVGFGPHAAKARVIGALQDLGPGLNDVALRCCCFLEGLESIEKRMGWSARSGKIVLRIALLRLKRYYAETLKDQGHMIG